MIKLSPVQFVCAILALVAAQGLALKFLGPDASTVTQLVALAAAAVMRLGPSSERASEPPPVATEESKKPDLKVISGGLLLLVLIGFAPLACSAQNVDRSVVSAGYALELKDCLVKGKAVDDLAVYTACADDVDVRYGLAVAKDGGK